MPERKSFTLHTGILGPYVIAGSRSDKRGLPWPAATVLFNYITHQVRQLDFLGTAGA